MSDPTLPPLETSDRSVADLERDARAALGAIGADARAVAFAPGRVNLIGDHTDYNGGLAFPAALHLGCVAALAWGDNDGRVLVAAADLQETDEAPLDPTSLDEDLVQKKMWARYVAGVLALGSKHLPVDTSRGLRCAVASSVPIGSGLSSSAAIEVAAATALEALVGTSVGPLAKARWCQAAEHRYAGTPCGLLDQLSSIHAMADHGLVIDFADLSVRQAALPPPDVARFVLLDSGVTHDNASGGYAHRRAACERAASAMGVQHLAHATLDGLRAVGDALTADEIGVARHVITETRRVRGFASAAERADLHLMGSLMNEAHRSMSVDFAASDPVVDAIVEAACADDDLYGARMTGGGFGGFVVALVKSSRVASTVTRLRANIQDQTGVDTTPRLLTIGQGARALAST